MGRNFWIKPLLVVGLLTATLSLAGCSDDGTIDGGFLDPGTVGATGATGTPGTPGTPGATGATGATGADGLNAGGPAPETCAVCHEDAGDEHQASYDELYQDGVIQVTDLAYTYAPDQAILTFKMTKNGASFDCTEADSIGSYFASYDGTTFPTDLALMPSATTGTKAYDSTTNVCTTTLNNAGIADLTAATGIITLYGVDEILYTNSAKHLNSGKYPFAAILRLGTVDYESTANVSGCEKCHTKPYLKHTYIYGAVNGTDEFYTCKGCHYDTRPGHVASWQLLVDDPAAYAAQGGTLTAEQNTQYAYIAKLMNDVHMSHAMEFGYPQSMSNCATCHEGKLDRVMTDANFTIETCKSCHPVTGPADPADAEAGRAPALKAIWAAENVAWHTTEMVCNQCHKNANTSGAPGFSTIHTGYNPMIYADAAGTKYSDLITGTIDAVSVSDNVLTISFSATGSAGAVSATDITPTLLVSLYGYDTKDFLVSNHGKTIDADRDGEFLVGAAGNSNARFTTVSAANGSWVVTMDLSAWADKIADGSVKRAEVSFLPTLKDADGVILALDAPSRTFNLTTNAFDDSFYSPIVKVATGCNNCHDALATTFHSADRGGNIVVCRMCHTTASGGYHLEMQSRSIDSYIHAIHSFQAFDPGNIDFSNAVEALYYEHKIESDYPTFGITNCESCHNSGTYNVPDQSKSLPGVLSAAATWTKDRNIGAVPSYVAGPGSRACGSCHRAKMINEDEAVELTVFNQHTKTLGYLVENATGVWDSVVETIMALFQ